MSSSTLAQDADYYGYDSNKTQEQNVYDGALPSDLATVNHYKYTASAVIMPQDIAAGNFIQVTLSDGTSQYNYALPAAKTFDSGKVYVFNITANATCIQLTSTVTNWTTGETVDGAATF